MPNFNQQQAQQAQQDNLWGTPARPAGAALPGPAPSGRRPGDLGGLPPEAASRESIVYLGFNNDKHARKIEGDEIRKYAAKNGNTAAILTGNGENEADQGILRWVDHRTGEEVEHNLSSAAGVQKYLEFLEIGKARKGETAEAAQQRMQQVVDIFCGAKDQNGVRSGGFMPDVRDEMGQFLEVLQHVQNGHMDMDRLILSGHSNGEFIYSEEGESSPGTTYAKIARLMSLFPKAHQGVEDLMFSACHTHESYQGTDNTGGRLGKMLAPNAKLMWGYDGKSPAAGQAAAHELAFLKATEAGQGPDAAVKAARAAGHAATVHKYR